MAPKTAEETPEERLALLKEIDRFIKTPCSYFPYGGPPAFSKLSRQQRRYYAYFRTILDSDGDIRGDEGYYRLLAIECLTTEEGRRKLEDYLSEERGTGFYNFARDLLPELRIRRGADPGGNLGLQWDSVGLLLTQMFLPRYRGATEEQLNALLSVMGFGYSRRLSSGAGLDIFGQAIAVAEDSYIGRTGRSLGGTFSGEKVSMFRRAFAKFLPEDECTSHAINYYGFDIKGIMQILAEVADCAESNPEICTEEQPSERSYLFLSEDTVKKILDLRRSNNPFIDTDGGGVVKVVTADGDGRMPGEVFAPETALLYSGELRPADTDRSIEYMVPESGTEGDDGPYYPSGLTRAPDGTVSGLEYYRFWRDRLAEGRPFPADTAMIVNRYIEMRKHLEDPETVYRQLMRAIRPMKKVPKVLIRMAEHLVLSGDLPVDRTMARISETMGRHLLFRIIAGRRQPVERWLLTDCLDIERIPEMLSDVTAWDAFRMTLISSLRTAYRLGALKPEVTISSSEPVWPEEPEAEFSTLRSIPRSLVSGIEELASEVGRAVSNRLAGRRRRKPLEIFGIDVCGLMNSSIDAAFRMDAERNMAPVDQERVRQVREDLEYVVKAVGTEEEEAPEEEKEPDVPDISDPWAALIASLSPEEARYLESGLTGGPTDIRLESSINEAAAELIGDALIEDGKIYEEYTVEISRRLKAGR